MPSQEFIEREVPQVTTPPRDLRVLIRDIRNVSFKSQDGGLKQPLSDKLYFTAKTRKLLGVKPGDQLVIFGKNYTVDKGRTPEYGDAPADIVGGLSAPYVQNYLRLKLLGESANSLNFSSLFEEEFFDGENISSPRPNTLYATKPLRQMLGVEVGQIIPINGHNIKIESGRTHSMYPQETGKVNVADHSVSQLIIEKLKEIAQQDENDVLQIGRSTQSRATDITEE